MHQDKGALDHIYKLIVFMQKKRNLAHDKLVELMSCLEQYASRFFLIYNDVSKSLFAADLKDRVLNICVTKP